MLGLRNAPREDLGVSMAEVVFGTPLRVPGMCFDSHSTQQDNVEEQLRLARANVRKFTPRALNQTKFKVTPFISKNLKEAKYVYVRDSSLAKSALQPRYSGPY